MMDLQPPVKQNIVFVDVVSFENDSSFRGGALVTDTATYPLEFRLTSPIRPTPLQKTLYGKTLQSYIVAELIAIPLLKSLKVKPALAIANSNLFLAARPQLEYPIICFDANKKLFQSHANYPNDMKLPEQIFKPLNFEQLAEPFLRIQAAISEAHRQKIGEN